MTTTRLLLDDVARILRPLGLKPRAVSPIAQGTVNSCFRVDSDGGPLFLRVNEGKREEEVAYEGALLWHLGARRFPTPAPLRTSSGRPYLVDETADGRRLISVFPWVVGEHVDEGRITAAHAGQVGEVLARLHVAAASFPRQRRGIYTYERMRDRTDAFRARAAEVPFLAEALPVLDAEFAWQDEHRPSLATLPSGTIHGDLFPDNLLWQPEARSHRLAAVLDFEQACRGRFAYDLAVALLSHCWAEDTLVEGLAWSMVSGYERARTLSPAEREGLVVEARFAALRFTVTRITDVLLPSLQAGEPPRADKHPQAFLSRLRLLRERGESVLAAVVGERPPLRAV